MTTCNHANLSLLMSIIPSFSHSHPVASILYYPSPSYSFLLDCGEGMTNQLLRISPAGIRAFTSIKAVLLSHSHADHHLGLPLLLRYLVSLQNEANDQEDANKGDISLDKRLRVEYLPIRIVGPPRVRAFLEMWEELVPSLKGSYVYVDVKLPKESVMKEWNPMTVAEEEEWRREGYDCSQLASSHGMKILVNNTGAFDVDFLEEKLLVRMIPVGIPLTSSGRIDN